jgi:type VI secretion system ImpC/EvpB family protein
VTASGQPSSPGVSRAARSDCLAIAACLVAEIDELMTEQVNQILHHPAVQQLESSWRGLAGLVDHTADARQVHIRVLNVTWPELCRDLDSAVDVDQSGLFHKVYTQEFDTPGGTPFGVLLGDFEMRPVPGRGADTDDMAALSAVARVAAAAFAPFVTTAAPAFFEVTSFRDLPRDLGTVFEQLTFLKWNALRDADDARFLVLTLPHVLGRLPHEDDGSRSDQFRFAEDLSAPDGTSYLWGSAIYGLGCVLVRAFVNNGWFADISGVERNRVSRGLVTGLPVAEFPTEAPTGMLDPENLHLFAERQPAAARIVTEVALLDTQDLALANSGFMPLSALPGLPLAAFISAQTIQRPRRYDRAAASVNARLSTRLGYILCVSRFAHYIKAMWRGRIGTATSAAAEQTRLQDWLRQYTTASDDADNETKARYPLRNANVELQEIPGRDGAYNCIISLQPHFQFDDAAATIRLYTEFH